MCGEHQNASRLSHGPLGSSPHVRGARCFATVFLDGFGIIPACAGSTCPSRPSAATAGDHPRMCGEHRICCQSCKISTGSSPHVRGALVQDFLQGLSTGIIPACAGSTTGVAASAKVTRDHPRMCGEHGRLATMPCRSPGSSPHVRGAQRLERQSCSLSGIIPACAGSTPTATRPSREPRDHPRMCGEHPLVTSSASPSAGSSPHVRGARHHLHKIATRHGIIPACAGSTFNASFGALQNRDHPRMCGEHAQGQWAAEVRVGLSPHVRGAHRRQPQLRQRAGIIPACAGSTCWSRSTSRTVRDHPRMCGEHFDAGDLEVHVGGSSPHVRGAPRVEGLEPEKSGIIPACAGSTMVIVIL